MDGSAAVLNQAALEGNYVMAAPIARCLREPPADPITEADLSLIWEGQRYPEGALRGPDGAPLRVISPGRRGGGAGPDFRAAVVSLEGGERVGDVELHVRASYYQQHGHHLDPAYDSVILHVVYHDDAGGWTALPRGERVPVAAFAPWVEERAADIAAWALTPALWTEPCRDAASRLGDDAVSEVVRDAAVERLRDRASALAASSAREGAEEALWQALVEGLGYGGDREGFRRLARALPLALLRRLMSEAGDGRQAAAESALLAVAGLAGGEGAPLPPPMRPALRRGSSRPANRPEVRLAALAALLARARGELLAHALHTASEAGDARELLRAWTQGAGIGPARATELLLNAVLPLLLSVRPEEQGRWLELAAALPVLPPYGKSAALERNLVRPSGKRRVRGALDQQGLLQMQASWCSQGGCGRCPLS